MALETRVAHLGKKLLIMLSPHPACHAENICKTTCYCWKFFFQALNSKINEQEWKNENTETAFDYQLPTNKNA